MVLCLLALPIFAILGIFSVKYRKLTSDALDCLFRTITLRKCRSGLDEKIKSDVTGTVLRYSPKTAKFVYKHYKVLSWIVLIIFIWSFYVSAVGLYNYVSYGNCNGPESTDFCIFDITGENSKISELDITIPSKIVYPSLEEDDPIIGEKEAELTIIEFGCYMCPYTKKAEPTIQEVLDYYEGKINFQFKTFYIPHHNLSYKAALAANCAQEQDKYIEYHNTLLDLQDQITNDFSFFSIATNLGLDTEQFKECFYNDRYKKEIDSDTLMGLHAGVVGTPTFFINEQKIVGPKPFKTFKKIINRELK